MPKFVITGASGGGKSTLITALAAEGSETVAEVGRVIVSEQLASGGTALPWEDRNAFMEMLFARSLAAFDSVDPAGSEPVFFDRSFIEAIAYCAVIGRTPSPAMLAASAARRFDAPVFVCPPWEAIFARDPERRHDFDFAVRDHEANVSAYRAAGYDLIEIPRLSVEERVAFIKNRVAGQPVLGPSNRGKNR